MGRSARARITGRIAAAPGAGRRAEAAGLAGIVALAAATRFVNLPGRGGWDADQAVEMAAMRRAVESGTLPTFGPEAISVGSSFHHGALYYDLLLPAVWLGGGDPTFVVAEIALLSLLVVPIVWWMARTMAGPAAGLIAALLAAVSAGLIGYATFIWNPTLVEPAAAVAFLGAWQAWRSGRPRWWVVAAAGTAVAAHAHVAAAVLALPMAAVFLADLRRGPARQAGPAPSVAAGSRSRRRIAAWGVAGVALVAATYAPVVAFELSHNFAETRGMLGYLAGPDTTPARDPITRILFAAVRIPAWPLTSWPLVDLRPGFLPALAVALCLIYGLLWRLLPGRATSAAERDGARFTAGLLALTVLALGLGLKAVSVVQELPTEQYHVAADPLVFVAAGLVLGALWRAGAGRPVARLEARACVVAALAFLCAWNATRWPPLTAPKGNWPQAQAAADRIQQAAGRDSIALVPLFVEKGVDAYSYPLALDGVRLVDPEQAAVVVVLCDRFWLEGCGGEAEERWRSGRGDAAELTLVERFDAAPDRVLSIYRRGP